MGLSVHNFLLLASIGFAVWMRAQKSTRIKDKLLEKYDYVVVGAGSAGSVVASRLSEDADVTVAVLEAGVDNEGYPIAKLPGTSFELINTELNWGYETIPQKTALRGFNQQKSILARGRVLGGTGRVNAMWYVRGHRHDYDRWQEVYGADGWSYADVLPYFIKSESHDDEQLLQSGYHGRDGPWKVKTQYNTPELTEVFLNASEELGHNIIADINGKDQEGFSRLSAFVDKITGQRSDSYSAFLKPAMERENLHVLTEAHVTRILLENNKAVGVEYVKNGRLRKVMVEEEVILCAGAIASPQILMLSGIGHKEHLIGKGITPAVDLPVGDNLQDHLMVFPFDFLTDLPTLSPNRLDSYKEKLQYALFGTGIHLSVGAEAIGYLRSKSQPESDPRPYLQLALLATLHGASSETQDLFKKAFNLGPEVSKSWFKPQLGKNGFTLITALERPASIGTVRLQSANPFHHPVIDPKYFSEKSDVDKLLEAIRHNQRYIKTEAFRAAGIQELRRPLSLCEDFPYDSDEYWTCFIRATGQHMYHPTSTCKMGRPDDKTTVVDSKLRVHGIQGLRVADASITPETPNGNTHTPTVMIAEKAADMIRGRRLPPIKDL